MEDASTLRDVLKKVANMKHADLVALLIFMCVFSIVNASQFDETEIKMLIETTLMLIAWKTGKKVVTGDESSGSTPS